MEADREEEEKRPMEGRALAPAGVGPCLVYLHGKGGKKQTVFSLSNGSYQNKSIHEMRWKTIATSSHGWLVVVSKPECPQVCWFLLNAYSMEKIKLPPPCDFVFKEVVLSLPPDDPKCVVMLFNYDYGILHLKFCKPGDSKWTGQDFELRDAELGLMDCPRGFGVYNGEINMLTSNRRLFLVKVDDDGRSSARVTLLDLEVDRSKISLSAQTIQYYNNVEIYLVETCGHFLLVEMCFLHKHVRDIRVFTFDFRNKVWIRINRMENHAIFIGRWGQIHACSTTKTLGIQENTVYFILHGDKRLYEYDLVSCDFNAYLPCPNVIHDWSAPDWIIP